MEDSSENILVDFDYNNIAIIDPNKVIDENGKAKQRLVKHENLVMYANLECKVLPRTKLLIGASNEDNLRTIAVTSMNFLNPGQKKFLDNSYTDEITGKNTLRGEGVNQQRVDKIRKPNKTDDYYYKQSTLSNGELKATDNGLLGIKSITVKQGLDLQPVISIQLEDVKGRALFESGNDSPYSAFFNLPYPMFYLTIKGFYGKATKYALTLQDFNSTYNAASGNFEIDLKLYAYKFSILTDVTVGALQATPHMYRTNIKTTTKTASNSNQAEKTESFVEYGYQKVKELYSEYKSKGLIPEDFPELTMVQMKYNVDKFIQNVLETFQQQNLVPLTNLQIYSEDLESLRGFVFSNPNSWFNQYMDKGNYFLLKQSREKKIKVYTFLPEFYSASTENKITDLLSIISDYQGRLNSNVTCGSNGSYEINGRTKPSSINFLINRGTIEKIIDNELDIDFEETYRQRNGGRVPTPIDINELTLNFKSKFQYIDEDGETKYKYFIFDGENSFTNILDKVAVDYKAIKEKIEKELTDALAQLIQNKDPNLGFVPTLRNVLAVIFANGEAFLRMLDDVHIKAWDKRNSPIRKAAIFKPQTSGANPDVVKENQKAKVPIYPWPTFLITNEKDNEKFQPKYPGDSDVINDTKAFLYDEWPEVEFVEEFTKGLSLRLNPPSDLPAGNEAKDSKRISLNAIEYPTNNNVYADKQESKFFYEIYERLILSSFYSKLSRTTLNNGELNVMTDVVSEEEKTNIIESLASQNPFLREKLKNYLYNSANFLSILRAFSNQGIGESWQNFIRGIFNTPYIKNAITNNSFSLKNIGTGTIDVNNQNIQSSQVTPGVNVNNINEVQKYLTGSSISNKFDFTDLYPFVDKNWDNRNMSGVKSKIQELAQNALIILSGGVPPAQSPPPPTPITEYFDTTKILRYNTQIQTITNFDGNTYTTFPNQPKPFSGYNFKKKLVRPIVDPQLTQKPEHNLSDLPSFYNSRVINYDVQLPTEGNLNYNSKAGLLSQYQTVSILNTPIFINSIQQGVQKFRDFDIYPYKVPAYLFLNSLPLSSLREKYSVYTSSNQQSTTQYLNYIFATFKKYGAVHKVPLPWVLKLGAVWHRYKNWVETGQDMLDECWRGFEYAANYDPITSASTTDYSLTIDNGQNILITLEEQNQLGVQTFTQLNTGFYPKLINDFNVFYQGFRVFTGYTESDLQSGITNFNISLLNVPESNITMNFSGDVSNLNRMIQINAWSVYVTTEDKQSSYVFPSHGSQINQVRNECFKSDGKLAIEVSGNTSIYNGSVRSFWAAPNYGYFDIDRIVKPNPEEYMRYIFGGYIEQQNFSLNGSTSAYTNIGEIFSVFEKSALDAFEERFLNFSKSKYSYSDFTDYQLDSEKNYGNFQLFMTQLMKVPAPPTGATSEQILLNIQENQIKNFTAIDGFMNYDVLMKYGNPSNFDRGLFYSFSDKDITDRLVFESYNAITPNALPSQTGTQTLVGSKLSYPLEWKALLEYVGFSDLPGVQYSNTGCTIFDFFIDFDIAFSVPNIKICAPIIKIYASQKHLNSSLNAQTFKVKMGEYITSNLSFIDKTIDKLFPKVSNSLDDINISKDVEIVETLIGEQTKLELYESFKATNDKWISGTDFKNKTLFEDILLLDRASRDIGNQVVIDLYKLQTLIDTEKGINAITNMMILTESIIRDTTNGNFTVMYIPGYINFYGVQEVSKNPKPKPEGSLELANTLFGTFTSVDTRNSSTKMVCFYGGKPSVQLDAAGIIDGFKNDAFDLRKASDNPLVENQVNKNDWGTSNKVVGFNVEFGPQNQGVFDTFSVSQKNSTPTAESLKIITDMANQAGGRGFATQDISLYNLYKLRSYECNVTMLGNALIQPLMYFNLRYVPMFSGPYMIQDVTHTIGVGSFKTSFNGIRQPIASYSVQVDFLQSLRTNLIQQLINKSRENLLKERAEKSKNIINNRNNVVEETLTAAEPTSGNTCSANTKYTNYVVTTAVTSGTSITISQLKSSIDSLVPISTLDPTTRLKLVYAIFSRIYLQSKDGPGLVAYNNNYAGIDLLNYWGPPSSNFTSTNKFFCVNKGADGDIPYAIFDSLNDNIKFLISRWENKAVTIRGIDEESVAEFISLNSNVQTYGVETWVSIDNQEKTQIINAVKQAIQAYNSA